MKMRTTLLLVLTILFVTLICLPASFAQNTSPENLVRLIYFLPNDRTPQPGVDTKLDTLIKDTQLFFADVLEKHGFGRKTFQFETNVIGKAVVHRVNGKFTTEYYNNSPDEALKEALEELSDQFDLSKNIYTLFIDNGSYAFFPFGGSINDGAGGYAVLSLHDTPVAHELGHAFGLAHDYYRYEILKIDWMLESFCAAEWLDVNRYFNTDSQTSVNTPATVRMLPPLAAPSHAIRLRFEVTDADGPHQAQLLASVRGSDDPVQYYGSPKLIDCQSFNSRSNTVEFITDALTGGPATVTTEILLHVTDKKGNFTTQSFSLNIASLLPRPEVVLIPDTNLEAVLRRGIDIAPGEVITHLDMVRLRRLTQGGWAQIADLTGIERAINLTHLNIAGNKISDLKPLAGLTQLNSLNLRNNRISDITPLAGLTQLTSLNLENNRIKDLSPLTNLVDLSRLSIAGNPIVTIPPMAQENLNFWSGEVTVIEGGKFIVCADDNEDPKKILNIEAPITVRNFNFNRLLHSSNLTGFFDQGGTIELLTLTDAKFGDVVISEIMWGLDGASPHNQWVELYNTTSNDITLDPGSWGANWALQFSYGPVSEWKNVKDTYWKVVDRVSNLGWRVPGQSGNTARNQPLISMYRTIDYETASVPDGTLASSWKASIGRVNLLPPSRGTPGMKHLSDGIMPVNGNSVINKVSVRGQIGFSEIMVASSDELHSLPQWIELYNNSDTETVDLKDWQLHIEAREDDGTHRYAVILLKDLSILPKQTALMVTSIGRNSGNFPKEHVYNFLDHHSGAFERNAPPNMVIGSVGFSLKLLDTEGVVSDEAGNLDGDNATEDKPTWELPSGTTENMKRTSLMRRYAVNTSMPLDGRASENWTASSELQLSVTTYWGKETDIGNPGYRGKGALPVTLSRFRAEKTDVGVVIKWTTESELENAGFNILRCANKHGQFVKVNPTLIAGAGTTSEGNDYTWKDTTGRPNVPYYYQIEDVSFSGERQHLAMVRMRGHISARAKLTTTWANLKTQE